MAKTLSNFKIDEPDLLKAKYVAWFNRTSLTAMIVDDLSKRVAKFEKENGEITPALIKKMEESK